MNTKIIKFDINKNLYDILIAKQGDTKSRFLLFNLLDGAVPFSLENRSVRVYAIKPDGTEVFNDLIVTDPAKGYCVLELTTQMLAVAGTVKLELMVIEEDKKLTSNIFYIDVKKSINSEKAIVSTNEFGALLTSLQDVDNWNKEFSEKSGKLEELYTKRLNELGKQLETIAVNVECFRFLVENDDWTKAIRKAIEKAGVGGSIIFNKDTIYTITGQLDFLKNQCIKGNGATLKRANESKAQITASATSSSTTLTFASVPDDWEVGDMVHIFVGQSMADSSNPRKIKSISGNTITLESSIGKLIGESNETSTYPVKTWVRKTYTMISSQQYPIPYPVKIDNLILDGNRNNNNSNYYWYCNSCISVYGHGTEIKDCKFYSISNECIVTHGANIINCYGEGLNGSFVHLSAPPKSLGEEFLGTFITNNIVKRSNAINPTVTGHSKAVIEQSWNAGKTTIIGNQFEGCGYGVCFDLLQQTLDNEKAYYSEFIIVGNTFKNYAKISDDINSNISWELENKIMTNNIFDNCGTNDFTNLKTKNSIFLNNTLSSGTTVKGYLKNIKEIYGDSYAQLILSSGANSLSLMHMSNGETYFQKGSTQYFYVDSSNRFILNLDTMLLNSQKGVVKLNDFQLFISDSMTDAPWRNYMNSTYKNLSIGSEVYFPNIPTPTIYKKVAVDTWVTIPTTVF